MTNPCGCWNLRDGCIAVGVWTLIFSITEIGLLGWQTSVIGSCREQLPFIVSQWPSTCTNLPQECPCTSDMDIEKMTSVLNAVFIIQILNLINVGFLLIGSFCLIYGVYSGSKFWLWAWLPPGVLSVPFLLAYCISWWAGDTISYWVGLTVVAAIAAVINAYCVACVMALYSRWGRMERQRKYGEDYNDEPEWKYNEYGGGYQEPKKPLIPEQQDSFDDFQPQDHSSPQVPKKVYHQVPPPVLEQYEYEPYQKQAPPPAEAEPLPPKQPLIDFPQPPLYAQVVPKELQQREVQTEESMATAPKDPFPIVEPIPSLKPLQIPKQIIPPAPAPKKDDKYRKDRDRDRDRKDRHSTKDRYGRDRYDRKRSGKSDHRKSSRSRHRYDSDDSDGSRYTKTTKYTRDSRSEYYRRRKDRQDYDDYYDRYERSKNRRDRDREDRSRRGYASESDLRGPRSRRDREDRERRFRMRRRYSEDGNNSGGSSSSDSENRERRIFEAEKDQNLPRQTEPGEPGPQRDRDAASVDEPVPAVPVPPPQFPLHHHGLTIPQHIVIPPSAVQGRKNVQISSEITITYAKNGQFSAVGSNRSGNSNGITSGLQAPPAAIQAPPVTNASNSPVSTPSSVFV